MADVNAINDGGRMLGGVVSIKQLSSIHPSIKAMLVLYWYLVIRVTGQPDSGH